MSISLIFPEESLTKAEEIEITQVFSLPTVKKYLRILGAADSKDLLSLGILDMPDRDIANRHQHVSGKLAVIATLLSISQN